jgi:voltage-gated sodium channel
MKLNNIDKVTGYIIVICAFVIGIETYFRGDNTYNLIFNILDILFVSYFTFEIILRFKFNEIHIKYIPKAFKIKFFEDSSQTQEEDAGKVLEHWFWLLFDFLLVIGGIIAFFRYFTDHPESLMVLRLLRLSRLFRLFDFNSRLRQIERKILSVLPTVLTFGFLLFLILYVYSIIGMSLYNNSKWELMNFSSLYSSFTSLFTLMSNDWFGALIELKTKATWINPIISDLYVYSFFIFSVMVTLNVFLAVMTSQIQDKIDGQLDIIKRKEDEISLKLFKSEKINEDNQEDLDAKMNLILNEIQSIKNELNKRK